MNKRIERNPHILIGKPVIKGTRIPVYLILNLLKNGYTFKKIQSAYPKLTTADIKAAITYAERLAKQEETLVQDTRRVVYA